MEKDERLKTFNGKKVKLTIDGCLEPLEGVLDFVSGTEATIKEKVIVRKDTTAVEEYIHHHVDIDDIKVISSTK